MATKAPIKVYSCKQCGVALTGRKRCYCSKACTLKYRHQLKHPKSWAEYVEDVGLAAKDCLHCGSSFKPAAKKDAGKYCSVKCYGEARTAYAVANPKQPPTESYYAKLSRLRKSRHRSVIKHKTRTQKRRDWLASRDRHCEVCGDAIPKHKRSHTKYCSKPCYLKSDVSVRVRRASKSRTRALKRGSNGGERFDPFYVFNRDGWRCYLCGVKTPKSKRGTLDDNAPELEHIVPLSKGGKHTKRNTACACRKCNHAKGDGVAGGQLLLIG